MSAPSKLLIIDGYSLLFRAYFGSAYAGANILRASDGTPTNALLTFNRMLINVLEREKPTHLLVAFDAGGKTHRHAVLASYKAGRAETPPDLRAQINLAKQMLQLMGVKLYELPNFEADDIVATAAKTLPTTQTVIFSSDRDLLQLVDAKTQLLMPQNGGQPPVVVNAQNFHATVGCAPSQVPDLKGLVGDASDNLPGVKGIGPKTAQKLLTTYHSLENIYAHLNELAPAVQEKLIKGRTEGFLSKEMALLSANVVLPFDLNALEYKLRVTPEFLAFLSRYELKTLLAKFEPLLARDGFENISF